MAFNDHTDWRWDDRVLRTLASLRGSFLRLCGQLSECLVRFDGYAGLYSSAFSQAEAGQRSWIDASDRDSCHMVWIQFHEDLLATLGDRIHPGRVHFDLEGGAGTPSRWNTLRALRVLRWWNRIA